MTRASIVALHVAAIPAAVAGSALVSGLVPAAISEELARRALNDTYVVVAHFHTTVLLACLVLISTGVALACHSLNWLIKGAWLLFGIHAVTTVVPWNPAIGHDPSAASSHDLTNVAWWAYPYITTAFIGFLITLLGLSASLIHALRSHGREST